MNAPLTAAAFRKAGVRFGTQRQETAAGSIDVAAFTVAAKGERGAILNWLLMHRSEWPREWDDAVVASRLPAILAANEAALAAARAAGDKPAYQAILRAACAALFA